jgi:hypothetical protein
MKDLTLIEFESLMKSYFKKYDFEKSKELIKLKINNSSNELTDSQNKAVELLNYRLKNKYSSLLKNKRFNHIISDKGIVENVIGNLSYESFYARVIINVKNQIGENRIMFNSYNSNYLHELNKGDVFYFRGIVSDNQFGSTFHFGINNLWLDEIKPSMFERIKKIFK